MRIRYPHAICKTARATWFKSQTMRCSLQVVVRCSFIARIALAAFTDMATGSMALQHASELLFCQASVHCLSPNGHTEAQILWAAWNALKPRVGAMCLALASDGCRMAVHAINEHQLALSPAKTKDLPVGCSCHD